MSERSRASVTKGVTTMSRAFARLCLMIAALVMVAAAAAPAASAQELGDLEPGELVEDSAEANAEDDADQSQMPYNDDQRGVHFVVPDAQPGSGESAGGTGGGDAGAGLALTGTDVEPIIAISAGLLAVGGSALVASRRRLSLFD